MSKLAEFREVKDAFFRSHQSPLSPEQHKTFGGLKYFDENPALRLKAQLHKYPKPEQVQMATSTGHIAVYLKYGYVQFSAGGQSQVLQVYKSTEHDALFLPFMDATSGHETYGSGRYLDVEEERDGTLLLDFNMAYNPYCAYNEQWSCPIPTRENRLTARIEAGEKTYLDH